MPTSDFSIFNDRGLKVRELERLANEFRQRQQYTPGGSFLQSPAGEVLLPSVGASASTFVGCSFQQLGNFLGTPPVGVNFTWLAAVPPYYDTNQFLVGASSFVIRFLVAGYYALNFSCGVHVPDAGANFEAVVSLDIIGDSYIIGACNPCGVGEAFGVISGGWQGKVPAGGTCGLLGGVGQDNPRMDVTFAAGGLQIAKIG